LPSSGPSPKPQPLPSGEPGRRRRFRFRSGAPYLVPFLAASAAALAFWVWRAPLLAAGSSLSLQSPETQVRQALAHQDRAHLEDVYGFRAGGTLELVPVRYAEVVPVVEGGRATVVALLDAEGRAVWRDRDARVSYVGRETFHMKPCTIALWCAEGDQFARLRGVLRALFRHDDELRAREERRVRAWQIRVERDGAEVGEDYEVAVPGGGSRTLRARYRLEHRGERWVFADRP
jgi:hypothetical protein